MCASFIKSVVASSLLWDLIIQMYPAEFSEREREWDQADQKIAEEAKRLIAKLRYRRPASCVEMALGVIDRLLTVRDPAFKEKWIQHRIPSMFSVIRAVDQPPDDSEKDFARWLFDDDHTVTAKLQPNGQVIVWVKRFDQSEKHEYENCEEAGPCIDKIINDILTHLFSE